MRTSVTGDNTTMSQRWVKSN